MRFSKKTVSFSTFSTNTRTCLVCGEEISKRGFAWVAHGRAHERRNEAIAFLDLGYWQFEPKFEKGQEVRFCDPVRPATPMRIEEVTEILRFRVPWKRLYKIDGRWWNAGDLTADKKGASTS